MAAKGRQSNDSMHDSYTASVYFILPGGGEGGRGEWRERGREGERERERREERVKSDEEKEFSMHPARSSISRYL